MTEPYAFTADLVLDRDESNHTQWLEARKTGLGGSDALVALGKSQYKSPWVLYAEKAGLIEETPWVEGDISNEASTWGTNLEPYVAEEFSRRTGYFVHDMQAMFRSREYPFMLANIDRFVDTPEGITILECKTRTGFSPLGWLSGTVPDYALVQLHHYMIVLGLDRGFVAVLVGGQQFAYYEVQRDPELCKQIIAAERELWNRIQTKRPPAVGGTPADSSRLSELYGQVDPESIVELGEAAEVPLLQYLLIKEQLKKLEAEKDTLENQLKDMLGHKEVGLIDGESAFSWKQVKSRSVSLKDVEALDPALAKKVASESVYRKFSVVNKWKRSAMGG